MAPQAFRFVLGSRSPRRLELLRQIVPHGALEVVPPRSSDESDFDDVSDWPGIEGRLIEIAQGKCRDVLDQLACRNREAREPGPAAPTLVIAADTVVVVRDRNGKLATRGQPVQTPSWPEVVRTWFLEDYAGKVHTAATALCVARQGPPDNHAGAVSSPSVSASDRGSVIGRVVRTDVLFRPDVEPFLDWYLATGEPLGKAGGYGIQGAGSIFVARIEGSLSNVIGLPIGELLEILTTQQAV